MLESVASSRVVQGIGVWKEDSEEMLISDMLPQDIVDVINQREDDPKTQGSPNPV